MFHCRYSVCLFYSPIVLPKISSRRQLALQSWLAGYVMIGEIGVLNHAQMFTAVVDGFPVHGKLNVS